MKVYLDDARPCPNGWVLAKTAKDAISLLENHNVSEISLDHDLGPEEITGTGYDVVLWIEEKVALDNYKPPKIYLHTANPSARQKMANGVSAIARLAQGRP